MPLILATCLVFLGACEAPEEPNAPPVGSGGAPTQAAFEPEPEPEQEPEQEPCAVFWDCAVACGDVLFGDEEQTARVKGECLDLCPTPEHLTPQTLTEWGAACAGLDLEDIETDPEDICEQGFDFCER